MLKRENRFSFKKGLPKKYFAVPFFVVRYEENRGSLKCSVVVGKKVDKKAVVRNKIKRQIVSVIQEILPLTTPFSIVIYARKPVLEQNSDKIKNELINIFEKLKIK